MLVPTEHTFSLLPLLCQKCFIHQTAWVVWTWINSEAYMIWSSSITVQKRLSFMSMLSVNLHRPWMITNRLYLWGAKLVSCGWNTWRGVRSVTLLLHWAHWWFGITSVFHFKDDSCPPFWEPYWICLIHSTLGCSMSQRSEFCWCQAQKKLQITSNGAATNSLAVSGHDVGFDPALLFMQVTCTIKTSLRWKNYLRHDCNKQLPALFDKRIMKKTAKSALAQQVKAKVVPISTEVLKCS